MFVLKALLKCLILSQCLGLAMLSVYDGAGISSYLFLHTGLQEPVTIFLNYLICALLLFIGIASIYKVRPVYLLLMGGIFATEAFFKTVLGGNFASNWTLGAHLVRYGWPLIFGLSIYLDPTFQSLKRWDTLLFLRICIATTFIIHGLEALMLHPKFIDFIIVANAKFFPFPATELFARQSLIVIGAVDIVVALLAVFRPSLPVLYYMAFWGALTAGARIVYAGTQGFPDAILRASHWAVPLLIAVLQFPHHLSFLRSWRWPRSKSKSV